MTFSFPIRPWPQGTELGPWLFLILMSDVNEGTVNSKIISFADDTRLYNSVSEVEDCDALQSNLNTTYCSDCTFNHCNHTPVIISIEIAIMSIVNPCLHITMK